MLVIGGAIFLITRPKSLKIVSYSPADGSRDVAIDAVVNVVFDRNLTDSEKNLVNIKIKPEVNLDSSWADKRLNFSVKNGFKTQSTYTVEVDYGGMNLLTFSFTTVDFTPEELKQQSAAQYPAERQFSEEWAQYITANPWVAQLPIENSNYRIVYDSIKKSFRIRILVSVSDTQKQQLINQALNDLKNIGVEKYFNPIPYYVLTQ